ncbi:MAG: TRAM domain-containing protein, partial [Bacilli bacterium]|nr:TRAM domain-containing protein [Bacilli bacterium]
MKVKIIDMDHTGNGIAKIDNKVIFIPKTITNDVCDIEIYETHKNYDKGKLIKLLESSPKRNEPMCPYYNNCGGCNISNLDYQEQLNFKENKVKNIFKKYLNIDINPKVIASPKEYNYRNKITYHYDNLLGLISEYDGLVDIDKCLLVSDKINNLYNLI